MVTPQHALLRVCASAIFFIPYLANFGDTASLNTLGAGSPPRPYTAQRQGLTEADVRGEGDDQRHENWLAPQGGLLHNSDPPPNVISYLRLLQPRISSSSRSGLLQTPQGNGSPPGVLPELYGPAVVPGQLFGDQSSDLTGSISAQTLGEIGALGLEELRFLKAILRLARLDRDDGAWRPGEAFSFRHGDEDYLQDGGDNTNDDDNSSEDQRTPSQAQGLLKGELKPMPTARQAEQLEQLQQLQDPAEKRGLYGSFAGVRNWWSNTHHQPRQRRPKVDRRAPESNHYRCLKNCITEGKLHPIQCHTLC